MKSAHHTNGALLHALTSYLRRWPAEGRETRQHEVQIEAELYFFLC